MKKHLPEIPFKNIKNPYSYFDIIKIEELFQRDLDHNIEVNHLVKFYILFIAMEGEGLHNIDFRDYNYNEGTVLLIRKDQVHKFFKNKSVKGFLLIFTEEFIIGHLNQMEALKTMELFNASLNFPKIEFNSDERFLDFRILIQQLEKEYNAMDDFSIGITRSVLHIIITKLFRIKSEEGDFIYDKKYISQFLALQKLVEANCFQSRKVQFYARELGVSTKTLNNITKEVVNSSAKSYIDEVAIMQIKRLLITTDLSIKEIAYTAGFSDDTNLFKYFKKFTDHSPLAFRQAC